METDLPFDPDITVESIRERAKYRNTARTRCELMLKDDRAEYFYTGAEVQGNAKGTLRILNELEFLLSLVDKS